MEPKGRQPNAAVILGGVGAVALIVSPFLKWITAQMDLSQILGSLGVPAGTEIPGFEGTINIVSGNGFEDQINGWVSLAGGIVALIGIVLVLVRLVPRSAAAYVVLAGGLLGGLWALYDGLIRFDSLLEDELAKATGSDLSGLPPGVTADQVKDALSVSPQIGVWVAALGGALVVVAALMIMTSRDVAAEMAETPGSTVIGGSALGAPAGGFGSSAGASTEVTPPPSSPPPTPPSPMPPAPPQDPPASTP